MQRVNQLVKANTTPTGTARCLSSSKTYQDLNGELVVSGDSVTYTIRVKNTGSAAATNVCVTDTLPDM